MTTIVAVFIWIAIYICFAGFISFLWGFVFKQEKLVIGGWRLALLGFLPHNISMIIRWAEMGYEPGYLGLRPLGVLLGVVSHRDLAAYSLACLRHLYPLEYNAWLEGKNGMACY